MNDARSNTLQWDGSPGHYEVYYLTLTDRGSGMGSLDVLERSGPATAWRKVDELHSDGRAHFEYAQRDPVEGAPLAIR